MNHYGCINQSTKFMQISLVFTYHPCLLFQESIQEVICILRMTNCVNWPFIFLPVIICPLWWGVWTFCPFLDSLSLLLLSPRCPLLIQFPYGNVFCKYFSKIWLFCHTPYHILQREVFNFNKIQPINLPFHGCVFHGVSKISSRSNHLEFLPRFLLEVT